jgi:hypothetical protein
MKKIETDPKEIIKRKKYIVVVRNLIRKKKFKT